MNDLKRELYEVILEKLTAGSSNDYQWPRWAAADAAAGAVIEYLDTIAGPHVGRHRKSSTGPHLKFVAKAGEPVEKGQVIAVEDDFQIGPGSPEWIRSNYDYSKNAGRGCTISI